MNDAEWDEVEALVVTGSRYISPYRMSVATVGNPPNADLIAHAPADIAWLMDEVDALRERVAILRADLEDLEDMADARGGDA